MGVEFWLLTGSMVGLFVFAMAYTIWDFLVGKKRGLPGEISGMSTDERQYLSSSPYCIPLTQEGERQALRKKNQQLMGRIGFVLLVFLVVGICRNVDMLLLLVTVCVFAGMYGLGMLYYRVLASGGIYEVKAVCLNIAKAGRGNGDGDLQYDFAFYDDRTKTIEGAILISRRKDMKEIMKIGMKTHLLLIRRRGRWRIFDWKE